MQYGGAGSDVSCSLGTTCSIAITAPSDMAPPVMLYYELSNFYQNHRRYVKSKSEEQLTGTVFTSTGGLADCDPLRSRNGKVLHPCGLIAQSYFNGACVRVHTCIRAATGGAGAGAGR